jgi:hypothetical protein
VFGRREKAGGRLSEAELSITGLAHRRLLRASSPPCARPTDLRLPRIVPRASPLPRPADRPPGAPRTASATRGRPMAPASNGPLRAADRPGQQRHIQRHQERTTRGRRPSAPPGPAGGPDLLIWSDREHARLWAEGGDELGKRRPGAERGSPPGPERSRAAKEAERPSTPPRGLRRAGRGPLPAGGHRGPPTRSCWPGRGALWASAGRWCSTPPGATRAGGGPRTRLGCGDGGRAPGLSPCRRGRHRRRLSGRDRARC